MPECSPGAPARAMRLRTPEQFAAAAGERANWRAARRWLAASARVEGPEAPEAMGRGRQGVAPKTGDGVESSTAACGLKPKAHGVRFGFTVARRQARRAVQRVMVKRVMREATRSATSVLRRVAGDRDVDLVLRLRSPLPERSQMGLVQLKRALRGEADSLINQLAQHLRVGLR